MEVLQTGSFEIFITIEILQFLILEIFFNKSYKSLLDLAIERFDTDNYLIHFRFTAEN